MVGKKEKKAEWIAVTKLNDMTSRQTFYQVCSHRIWNFHEDQMHKKMIQVNRNTFNIVKPLNPSGKPDLAQAAIYEESTYCEILE